MTGNELRELRNKSGKSQSKFYLDAGFFASYANPIENYYGDKQIPRKLENAIVKKYKKLLEK
jgi:hypothetical protein